MLLNHDQIIHEIVENKIIEGALLENVNASSLDIRLGKFILVESNKETVSHSGYHPKVVSLKDRDPICTEKVDIEKEGCFILHPGQFILAQSIEVFHLPLYITAEYVLKSSMARIGLEHLNAGYCDPGWHNSVLTLELRNLTTYHQIKLCYGDKIGQIKFHRHEPVDLDNSYARKGTYNGDREAQSAKPNNSELGSDYRYTNCKTCEG